MVGEFLLFVVPRQYLQAVGQYLRIVFVSWDYRKQMQFLLLVGTFLTQLEKAVSSPLGGLGPPLAMRVHVLRVRTYAQAGDCFTKHNDRGCVRDTQVAE